MASPLVGEAATLGDRRKPALWHQLPFNRTGETMQFRIVTGYKTPRSGMRGGKGVSTLRRHYNTNAG